MGKITTENRRVLENAANYDDAILTDMVDHQFTTELGKLIEQKGVSVLSIVEQTNVSKSYINKLRNPSERNVKPSRHVIINIALSIGATLDETNHLLKLARYQELYTRDKAESIIIWGMLKHLSGAQIREMLYDRGFDSMFLDN